MGLFPPVTEERNPVGPCTGTSCKMEGSFGSSSDAAGAPKEVTRLRSFFKSVTSTPGLVGAVKEQWQ